MNGIDEKWYRFRKEELEKIAIEWLEANQISLMHACLFAIRQGHEIVTISFTGHIIPLNGLDIDGLSI